MNSRKKFLKNILTAESKSYGFTIAFWGSGILLANYSGLPGIKQALLYGIGAVIGFGILTLYIYRGPFVTATKEDEQQPLVLGMVHYIAALLPITAAYYTARLPNPANFFVTGLSVSLLYNLGTVVEESLSEKGEKLEKRLIEIL